MRGLQIVVGIFFIVLSIFLYTVSLSFPKVHNMASGPAVFPQIILISLIVFSTIYVIQSIISKKRIPIFGSLERKNLFTLLLIFVVLLIYVLLFGKFSFLLLSAFTFFVVCKILKMKWSISILTSVILSGVVYYAFTKGFHVIL